MAEQQPRGLRGLRQAQHVGLTLGRNAVLPVEVAIADDREVCNLADASDAGIRAAAAEVVAQKGELRGPCVLKHGERLFQGAVVTVHVRDEAPGVGAVTHVQESPTLMRNDVRLDRWIVNPPGENSS